MVLGANSAKSDSSLRILRLLSLSYRSNVNVTHLPPTLTRHRFGIDKTDPSFKQTEGMKAVLKAQQENRRKKRKGEVKDVEGKEGERGGEGAMNLSALVANMKRKKAKS